MPLYYSIQDCADFFRPKLAQKFGVDVSSVGEIPQLYTTAKEQTAPVDVDINAQLRFQVELPDAENGPTSGIAYLPVKYNRQLSADNSSTQERLRPMLLVYREMPEIKELLNIGVVPDKRLDEQATDYFNGLGGVFVREMAALNDTVVEGALLATNAALASLWSWWSNPDTPESNAQALEVAVVAKKMPNGTWVVFKKA